MDYFATDHIIEPSRGDLLISEPYLPDPNFKRTVILLCEHDENGSFGFVLNKPSDHQLSEIMPQVVSVNSEVYIGGPVQQNTLHFLHDQRMSFDGDKTISDGIYWGIDFEALTNSLLINPAIREGVRFFVGYSGWSPGQLFEELTAKTWIVLKNASAEMVFDMNTEELWRNALKEMGGKFKVISNYPIDPRLN